MNYYIYIHKRKTDNLIFYVGKGKGNRAYSTTGRNPHWNNVVAKHGYTVEIVKEFVLEQDAYNAEIDLIAEIGLENLTNLASGGGVNSGFKWSKESRERLSKNNPSKRPEVREMRRQQLLNNNPIHNIDRTGKNNPMYGVRLCGAKNGFAKAVINLDTGKVFDTGRSASLYYNVDASCISRVCKKTQKTAGGYRWGFI
jgi:hypothetical protein